MTPAIMAIAIAKLNEMRRAPYFAAFSDSVTTG
jgi:hypothetical protein